MRGSHPDSKLGKVWIKVFSFAFEKRYFSHSASPFSSCFWSGIDGRCFSVLVRKEFLIDAKIRPHFRRIWTHVEGLCLRNDVAIGFRHSFLLQHILSPRWNHHFDTKRVEPARILEQLPTVCAV